MNKLLILAAAAMSVATAAHASLTPVRVSTTDLGGGQFLWDYSVTLTADSGLKVGSKFVIFDFQGYVPGSIKASYNAPFVASTELVTNTYANDGGVLPDPFYGDDPDQVNLVFTWENFPDFQTSGGPGDTVTTDFFTAVSIYGDTTEIGYGSRDIINYGALQSRDQFNEGLVIGPTSIGDTGGDPCVGPACGPPPGCQADAVCDTPHGGVPEPASWALMILGFGGVGAMLRSSRRPFAGSGVTKP